MKKWKSVWGEQQVILSGWGGAPGTEPEGEADQGLGCRAKKEGGVGVGWGVGRGSKSAVILLEGVLFCL